MEKGKYWLKKLSNKDRRSFTRNFDKLGRNKVRYMNKEFSSVDEFISSAFMWDETTEGSDYWYTRANPSESLAREIRIINKHKRVEITERLIVALVGSSSSLDDELLKQGKKYLGKKVKIETIEGISFFVV